MVPEPESKGVAVSSRCQARWKRHQSAGSQVAVSPSPVRDVWVTATMREDSIMDTGTGI